MIPTPEQRPDLYDGYDCQPRKPLSPEYLQQAVPEHLRAALAKRKPADEADNKSE
jgi:hypothetical protein